MTIEARDTNDDRIKQSTMSSLFRMIRGMNGNIHKTKIF